MGYWVPLIVQTNLNHCYNNILSFSFLKREESSSPVSTVSIQSFAIIFNRHHMSFEPVLVRDILLYTFSLQFQVNQLHPASEYELGPCILTSSIMGNIPNSAPTINQVHELKLCAYFGDELISLFLSLEKFQYNHKLFCWYCYYTNDGNTILILRQTRNKSIVCSLT